MRTFMEVGKVRLLRLLAIALTGMLPAAFLGAADESKPVQIGMSRTFFYGFSPNIVEIIADPFKTIIKATTGLNAEISAAYDPPEFAEKLRRKQLDFCLLYAHEF